MLSIYTIMISKIASIIAQEEKKSGIVRPVPPPPTRWEKFKDFMFDAMVITFDFILPALLFTALIIGFFRILGIVIHES